MTGDSKRDPRNVEYDPTVRAYYTNYAGDGVTPSIVVTRAIADITGRRVKDLRPLQEVIDPDALNDVFDHASRGNRPNNVEVTFTYADHDVTVGSSGVVEIHPIEDDPLEGEE